MKKTDASKYCCLDCQEYCVDKQTELSRSDWAVE